MWTLDGSWMKVYTIDGSWMKVYKVNESWINIRWMIYERRMIITIFEMVWK